MQHRLGSCVHACGAAGPQHACRAVGVGCWGITRRATAWHVHAAAWCMSSVAVAVKGLLRHPIDCRFARCRSWGWFPEWSKIWEGWGLPTYSV
jgi:hypothetical protein